MGGRFQRRWGRYVLSAAALSLIIAGPAPARQTGPKPKPGATQTAPPVIVPDPPRPGPPPARVNPSLITNPSWARQPVPDYPATALANGIIVGRVTLRCLALPDGALSGCEIIEETPAGQGFAASVIAAAARARLSPRTVDGAATGARVQFTTRFAAPVVVEPAPSPQPRRGRP